jgi:hypothetical protein
LKIWREGAIKIPNFSRVLGFWGREREKERTGRLIIKQNSWVKNLFMGSFGR